MNLRIAVLATAIALFTGAFATTAPAHEGPPLGGTGNPPGTDATLDPGQVFRAINDGAGFELPGAHGPIPFRATDRIQETIRYTTVDQDGRSVDVERAPNVWWMADEGGAPRGMVLSFDHTLRAWFHDDEGTTLIEPAQGSAGDAVPITHYVLTSAEDRLGALQGGGDEDDVGALTHIQVFKDVYAYVDTQFENQFGSCCWADEVAYMLGLLNGYFDDVELEYRYVGGKVDSGFNTNDISSAWSTLISRSYAGADVRSYWSYRDFDGCEVGMADYPGDTLIIQHAPDWCHLDLLPSTDVERAYLTAHELGKNNHAHPSYHWSSTTWTGHEHRSIMDESLWGHYHGCWSQTNMNRMSTYLGTSSVGTSCA